MKNTSPIADRPNAQRPSSLSLTHTPHTPHRHSHSLAQPIMTALSPSRPSKAQARWKLLRHAILSSASTSSASSPSSSPPPTPTGIRTYTVPVPLPCPSSPSSSSTNLTHQLPTPNPPSSSASTQYSSSSSSLAALVSHRPEHAGVDNTGNVQVWPAEEALLALLLKEGPLSTSCPPPGHDNQTGTRKRPRRILELGAGCTGLVGMGLAMAWGGDRPHGDPSSSSSSSACSPSSSSSTVNTIATFPQTTTTASGPNPPATAPSMYVCLTDGHPNCVSSLHTSLALTQAQLPPGVRVEVQRLVWKEEQQQERRKDETRQQCQDQLQEEFQDQSSHSQGCCKPFDLIVAADVLYFEHFHRALLQTLHTHLNPKGGEAWLLQPSRGGSLERFVALVIEEEGWEVVWEGGRGGKRRGSDDVESTQLQLLKLRRLYKIENEMGRESTR